MRTVLANDTSGTSNPGCQGTVACLLAGLHASGHEVVSRLPIYYSNPLFQDCFPVPPRPFSQRLVARARQLFRLPPPATSPVPSPFHPPAWEAAVEKLTSRLRPLWAGIDLLVVNGEGTIHHDAQGALTLIGLCRAARLLGKRVALVNASILAMHPYLLARLRDSVDVLTVREPISFRYLQENGVPCRQGADCLFLGEPHFTLDADLPAHARFPRPYVVYTPGVLTAFGRVDAARIEQDIQHFRQTGLHVVYYVVEAEDEALAAAALHAGAAILPLAALRWTEIPAFLRASAAVVSGRYHINIFAALAGAPFLPMETNTAKMQGLLELLLPGQDARPRPLATAAGAPPPGLDTALRIPPERLAHAASLARQSFVNLNTVN